MPKKGIAKSPFTGFWRIVSMSAWDEDYLHEEVQAYIEFEAQWVPWRRRWRWVRFADCSLPQQFASR